MVHPKSVLLKVFGGNRAVISNFLGPKHNSIPPHFDTYFGNEETDPRGPSFWEGRSWWDSQKTSFPWAKSDL